MRDHLILVLKKHVPEICAVALASVGLIVLAMSFTTKADEHKLVVKDSTVLDNVTTPTVFPTIDSETLIAHQENIYVDVSGAVNNPGVYSLSPNAHLSDAIKMAGGLSRKADADYFGRNYNTARLLKDQEKIYVPRTDEVADGTFVEGVYYIDHSLQRGGISPSVDKKDGDSAVGDASSSGININIATADELETLSGIGPVTAQKIIDNRPYADVNDLLTLKVVKESVFNNIKDMVVIGGSP